MSTDDIEFVSDGGIQFTASYESLLLPTILMEDEEDSFTSCVYVRATEDNLIEPDETVSILIDPDSLRPNDGVGIPDEIDVVVTDNDGKLMQMHVCEIYAVGGSGRMLLCMLRWAITSTVRSGTLSSTWKL